MNNLIENEIKKNAQVFLKPQDSFKQSAFDFFSHHGINDKSLKFISPRFMGANDNLKEIKTIDCIDKRAVLYFTDGSFDAKNSIIPSEVIVDSFIENNTNNFSDSFEALNALASNTPIQFTIKKNSTFNFPLTIIHTVTENGVNKILSPRLRITAEENCELSVLEVFTSLQNDLFQYTTNAFILFDLKPNSKIEHTKLVMDAKNSLHIGWTKSSLAKDARFNSTVITLGQVSSSNNLRIDLEGANAEASANSLFTLSKTEFNNIFTTINHKVSHTHSTQLCKGILKDESFGVFNGNITVAPDAQEITSSQLNKNLLLSKKAHIDTRPQLLVSADDVKCSHGATVGQLSDEEAFYLESRGIKKDRAKEMLMKGFSNEIIQLIKNIDVRNFCEQLVLNK